MKLSSISILDIDPEKVREDKNAKSASFFCLQRPVLVNNALITEMKQISFQRENCNVRVCLHESPEDDHHDMVVLEYGDKYYSPHKHKRKGECFHVIVGKLGLIAFETSGEIIDSTVLSEGELYRVAAGMYHAVLPLTDHVVYHESKPGPFSGEGDSIYPKWAPQPDHFERIKKYKAMVLSSLSTHR